MALCPPAGDRSPGGFIGWEVTAPGRPLFAVELTTSRSLRVLQNGRFINGPAYGAGRNAPAKLGRHRDTLISFLSGVHIPFGRGSVEPKIGLSVVRAATTQDGVAVEDVTRRFAFSAGADVFTPIGNSVAWVASIRYSNVDRGSEAFYLGVSRHVVRFGAGLKFGL